MFPKLITKQISVPQLSPLLVVLGIKIENHTEVNMKKVIVTLLILLFSKYSFSALPPKYQNMKDFDVLIEFIKKHEKVMSTLQSIDFENFVVYFGSDCKAVFERKDIPKPFGWAGPADPLEFKTSTCSLSWS